MPGCYTGIKRLARLADTIRSVYGRRQPPKRPDSGYCLRAVGCELRRAGRALTVGCGWLGGGGRPWPSFAQALRAVRGGGRRWPSVDIGLRLVRGRRQMMAER